MGLFVWPEWVNFVRVTRRRPALWAGYAWHLLRLAFRRVAGSAQLRLLSRHRGLKRWPRWLGERRIVVSRTTGSSLCFPQFQSEKKQREPSEIPQPYFSGGDCEREFASHRWAGCFIGALVREQAAEGALNDAITWIRNAPDERSAAWEPYSSSERVANLAVMLAVHPSLWQALDAAAKHDVARFFAKSAQWIHDHLEYYGFERTNNHILNNARALVIAGRVLNDEVLLERGLVLFTRMARELFRPEGSLRERSSHYQCVVTNWLMDTLHFASAAQSARGSERPSLDQLRGLSARVLDTTGLLMSADFGCQIGDISPDNHPEAATMRLFDLYPECFRRNGVDVAGRRDEWLSISNGSHRLLTCVMPAEYPFHYTTHGHDDLGSFVWSYDRSPVLVDAGRSSYNTSEATRLQSGPQGHNVLTVQGLSAVVDTLLANGRWCPSPYAEATISLTERIDGFSLTHDGFARIPGVGIHRREVTTESEGIVVTDSLGGQGAVEVDLYWHFATDIVPLSGSSCTAAGRGFTIQLDPGESGVTLPTVGWTEFPYAEAYGDVQTAFMVHVKHYATLPWSIRTTLKVTPCAE